ncbi:MAG: glycosyltransferase family 39 protein, partial [Candidatus Erginobacter occultus]|nr:glycosyltransferase family 39 protein [Candidatus Erginobacter occultus]
MRIKRLSYIVPLAVALLSRGIYLAEIRDTPEFSHPGLDAAYHIYWARGLAEGDWTAFEGREDPQLYRFPYYRPPGYAFFLTLVFRFCGYAPLWSRLFQFGLGLGSVLLVSRLGRRFFDDLTAFLAALGTAVYWIFIYYEGELVGVAWAVFLILFFAELLARAAVRGKFIFYLLAGAILGVLVLFRPNALLLFPAGVVWAAWPIRKRAGGRRLAAAAS